MDYMDCLLDYQPQKGNSEHLTSDWESASGEYIWQPFNRTVERRLGAVRMRKNAFFASGAGF